MTVSPRQLDIAKRIATRLGLGNRCSFVLGDFQRTALGLRANAILAVESFAHAADRDAFLANASRHLARGGHLIIVDDFLSAPRESLDARQRRLVDRLQAGWRVPGLCAPGALIESATRQGLVADKSVDLTPLTRPRSRARDHVVAALTPLFVRLGLTRVPFYGNMIGGDALQVGLREGFLRYRMVVLRRTA
jgi:SAM-dependent methyltransferase